MGMKNLTINSLAAAVLIAAVGYAGPGFAQGYSTPEEQAETARLNAEAANGTNASAEQLNGEDPETEDAAPPLAAYQAEQENYNEKQREYIEKRQDYLDRESQYSNERDRFNAAKADYNSRFGKLIDLRDLDHPASDLIDAKVFADGKAAGRVADIVTARDGDVTYVDIALTRGHIVSVDADDFHFDPDSHTLVTALNYDDLWDMPRARR